MGEQQQGEKESFQEKHIIPGDLNQPIKPDTPLRRSQRSIQAPVRYKPL